MRERMRDVSDMNIYIYTVVYIYIPDFTRLFALGCFPPLGFCYIVYYLRFGYVNILWL